MLRLPISKCRLAHLKRFKHTFEHQETIQKLPVPSIDNLKAKYLNSLKPLLTAEEFTKSSEIVTEFLGTGRIY